MTDTPAPTKAEIDEAVFACEYQADSIEKYITGGQDELSADAAFAARTLGDAATMLQSLLSEREKVKPVEGGAFLQKEKIVATDGTTWSLDAIELLRHERNVLQRTCSERADQLTTALQERDAARLSALQESGRAFKRGAREGWMRCGVYHIDIDFEQRESEQQEIDQRYPLAVTPAHPDAQRDNNE